MLVSPLRVHADLSVADIVTRVDALPDVFRIPPADSLSSGQGHGQSVSQLDVSFIHLDTHKHTQYW